MSDTTVTVHFAGGPADGAVRDLPAQPGGGPPAQWILPCTQPDPDPLAGHGPEYRHVYESDPCPDEDGTWFMRYQRTDERP